MLFPCLQLHTPHTLPGPTVSCHTSAVSSFTSVMDLNSLTIISAHIRAHRGLLCLPLQPVCSSQVKYQLGKLNRKKAAGSYGVSPRVLRVCEEALCGIPQYLFNLTLVTLKKSNASILCDYRPATPTSHIIKVLERLAGLPQ